MKKAREIFAFWKKISIPNRKKAKENNRKKTLDKSEVFRYNLNAVRAHCRAGGVYMAA
ncbi:MAG: hypothetical protein IKS21_01235 [Oscillospiraceae bacterium]|nr:hypothetical protein [Oscillospiraceae bacterium]